MKTKIPEIETKLGESLEDFLRREYVEKRKPIIKVALELGVSHGVVTNWLRKYDLPTRGIREAVWGDKPKLDEAQLRILYLDERKSTIEIANELKITPKTVYNWLTQYQIPIRNLSEALLREGVRKLTKEELEEEYLRQRKTTYQIAKEVGVKPCTIREWMRKFSIPRRNRFESLYGNITKPTKEQLEQLYIHEKKNTREIGEEFGVSNTLVGKWLKEYGFELRWGSKAKLPNVEKPSKKELEKLYVEQERTTTQIANLFNVSASTIGHWLKENKISTRNSSEVQLPKGFIKPSKEELEKDYITNRKNIKDISTNLGVSEPAVRSWLLNYGISIRSYSEARLPIGISKPTEKQLRQWYVEEKKSANQIANMLGVSNVTIGLWLKENKIQVRNKSGIYHNREFRKEIADRVLEAIRKSPEELTVTDFSKVTQKDGATYMGLLGWYKTKYKCKVGEARDRLVEDLYEVKSNRKIKTKAQLLEFLKNDELAGKLAVAAISLQENGSEIEEIIFGIYYSKFNGQPELHKLLQENSREVYTLIQEGFTNLGEYIGNFSLGDRRIIPVLIGQVINSLPEEKIKSTLEDKLTRILRTVYSPRFNDNPELTLQEIKQKVKETKGRKRKLYLGLKSHYQKTLELAEELNE